MPCLRYVICALCLTVLPAWGQQQDIVGLNRQALELIRDGRFVEAEAVARQAVATAESMYSGVNAKQRDKYLPVAQQRLGVALRMQGRNVEAESLLREALAGAERGEGITSNLAIKTQVALGQALLSQGRYAEADRELRRAVERAPAPNNDAMLETWLDVHVHLGRLQILIGNYAEAESLLATVWTRSAGVTEQQSLRRRQLAASGLAALREIQARPAESLSYARMSAELAPGAWGAAHRTTLRAYTALGEILFNQGLQEEAETWLQRGSAGLNDAKSYRLLAKIQELRGNKEKAAVLYGLALSAAEQGGSAETLLGTLRARAGFLSRQGEPGAAMPLYERALQQADRLFALSRGVDPAARENKLALLRPIYGEAIRNRVRLDEKRPGMGHDRAALADVSRTQSRLFTEMLRTADVARLAGNAAFVELKFRRDRLLAQFDEKQRRFALDARFDASGTEVQPARPIDDPLILARWKTDALAQQAALKRLAAERDAVESQLWREYPRYMELEEPRPVSVDDLQRSVLRPDEHLLAYFRLPHQLLIFMVSRDRFELIRVPVERQALDALVAQARQPMEAGGRIDALAGLDPGVLNRLYSVLLQPVQDRLPAKLPPNGRVLVAGDGPLFTLPFEMLVTRWGEIDRKAFNAAVSTDLAQYRTLDYAGTHWRFSYLPSLAALAMQRGGERKSAATEYNTNLLAFADPIFESAEQTPIAATRALLQQLGGLRDGRVSMPRLPETADEVSAVAKILGGEHHIYLRDAAQESRVKQRDLAHARYLHFATHGLLGGEFARLQDYDGADETADANHLTRNISVVEDADSVSLKPPLKGQPALVLTLVGEHLAGEDGLLTMTEVMGLNMNPELVVLSACNTAGEGEQARNGEGFAGLTRAFMQAGARGLLVSHWSVESLATRDLITEFFRRRQAGDAIPDALVSAQAALRQSRDDSLHLSRAHPFFWAPFVHVGD
jgi:CHAT domain-containing protein/Tfp pilus assembly protein PilF